MEPNIPTISDLATKFLDWSRKHRSPRSVEWYAGHLRRFLAHLGERAAMPVPELRPFHVVEWVDAESGWGDAYRRGAIMAIQRLCNWAEELGYIAANPIKKIRKPPARRRDNPMTPDDYRRILAELKEGDPFRDLLVFVWNTGCRPQEARHVEARHVHLESQSVVIPKEEAKGKRRPRVILLHGVALEIVTRLLPLRPEGKLFRNARGGAWNKYSICNRMDRLSKVVGKRLALYDCRHGFCQRLLESGVNHLAVAELMGHVNGQMVAAVYSHMHRATSHLREALAKAAT